MPKLELNPCEAVEVTFAGTDGCITVAFADHKLRSLIGCNIDRAMQTPPGISVHADIPDNSGRAGIVYHEPATDDDEANADPVTPLKVHGVISTPPGEQNPFSVDKARQLASDIYLLFKDDKNPSPRLMSDVRDQLMASANLVHGLLIELSESRATREVRGVSDVVKALRRGKL